MTILSTYLREVREIPLLSSEEELRLAKRCRMGDLEAREALISSNLRLVISIAKQYSGRGVPLDELISAGNAGLLKSLKWYRSSKGYRPARGYRFSTYAFWSIRCEVLKTFAACALIRMPEARATALRVLNTVTEDMLQRGEVPSPRKLAKAAKVTVAQVKDIYNHKVAGYVSLSAPPSNTTETAPVNEIPSSDPPFEDMLAARMRSSFISNVLTKIPEREADIIREYYGIGTESRRLEKIADKLHLTTERVRQLKERALKRLRLLIDRNDIE